MTTNIIEIVTTVGSEEQAQRLSRELVDKRLAACVQITPNVRSYYRWKEQLCDDEELHLSIKTTAACEQRILELFAEFHPYEMPEFVVTSIRGSEAYSRWVSEQVAE